MLRTNKQTDSQTEGLERPTRARRPSVGVGNKRLRRRRETARRYVLF